MKLGSLKQGGRDGSLVLISRDANTCAPVSDLAGTLQQALDEWDTLAPLLERRYHALNEGQIECIPYDPRSMAAPFPRAYQWLDGSAYLSHVERVRKARGAEMPESFLTDPLMYQGGSDGFLGPHDPICLANPDWGADFEAELVVVTDDVPMGVTAEQAGGHIRLLMLVNDVSLRNLIPGELAKGFGFLHGKPASAFAPIALTPDEPGAAWDGARLHVALKSWLNDAWFGDPDAGTDMQFGFPELIVHAAKTRALAAGTLIGSGTVSNADEARGCSCLAEKRVLEVIHQGEATTPFLRVGDRVRIEVHDARGKSLFGTIEQEVQACPT